MVPPLFPDKGKEMLYVQEVVQTLTSPDVLFCGHGEVYLLPFHFVTQYTPVPQALTDYLDK
jgi:hypothetical protein